MTHVAANPFTPTFGYIPSQLAGRESIVRNLVHALDAGLGNPDLSSILMGARGTGKTVLLSLLAEEAPAHGWIAVNVSTGAGMLEEIIDLTTLAADAYVSVADERRLRGVSVGQLFGIEWEYRDPSAGTWRVRMSKVLDALAVYEIGLLITVDEVRIDEGEMIKLISMYQHFVRERRKVALFMAGLPHQVSQLLNEESVTFLRRASLYRLSRIPDYEIRIAFEKTIAQAGGSIADDALQVLVDATEGYPYMMQLAGYRAWDCGDGVIDKEAARRGVSIAREELEYRVLAVTYRALSPRDRDFLKAMACDEGATKQADVAKRLHVTNGYVSQYKRRLLEQGVIEEVARGQVAFALPGMREYVIAQGR